MKNSLMLIVTSLLSIFLVTLHLTQDAMHAQAGTGEAAGSTLVAMPVLVVWLYGTLVLGERRSGHIIMLVGALLALLMPAFHVVGAGGMFRGQINKYGDFWFVWTMHALAITGLFSLILAVRGLWRLRSGQPARASS